MITIEEMAEAIMMGIIKITVGATSIGIVEIAAGLQETILTVSGFIQISV